MMIDVRPCRSRSSAFSIRISVGRSMFDVASSRIRMRGSASSARAIEISCRSPAERPGAALAHDVSEPLVEARRDACRCRSPRPSRAPARRSHPAARSGCCPRSFPRRGTDPGARRRAGGGTSAARRRAGRCRRRGSRPRPGRRSGRSASPASTCRGRCVRRARCTRPAGMCRSIAADDRLLAVREPDRVEVEPAVELSELDAPRLVADLRLRVEDGRDLLHRGAGRLHLPVEVGELLQRLEDEVEQEDRRDERADA